MRSQGRQRNRSRTGGAILEFALCAPILLYLLVAVSDFGRYYAEAAHVGQVAWGAAQRAAIDLPDAASEADSTSIALETFCECPFEPDVRFECGRRSCGDYGPAARYAQATAERPFRFMGRYPGFPREVLIRREAGVRAE